MEKSYVSPIIQRELERQYVDERILENPRSSEINDITLGLAKKWEMYLCMKEVSYMKLN